MKARIIVVEPDYEQLDFKTKLTIPNRSLSIAEILDRFVKRQPIPGSFNDVFIDQPEDDNAIDFEKLHHADMVDKQRAADDVADRIAESKRKYAEQSKPKTPTEPKVQSKKGGSGGKAKQPASTRKDDDGGSDEGTDE